MTIFLISVKFINRLWVRHHPRNGTRRTEKEQKCAEKEQKIIETILNDKVPNNLDKMI